LGYGEHIDLGKDAALVRCGLTRCEFGREQREAEDSAQFELSGWHYRPNQESDEGQRAVVAVKRCGVDYRCGASEGYCRGECA